MRAYACAPLFGQPSGFRIDGNPYRRPVRPQDVDQLDLSRTLTQDGLSSQGALLAQRLLMNVYEQELLFLPEGGFSRVASDFQAFYSDEHKVAGERVRHLLERHLFGFLDEEIDVSGRWNEGAMCAYLSTRITAITSAEESAVTTAIERARDARPAADLFLVQAASDFLSEASAMARNVMGNYGAPLSELFKVLVDEYGYGVHQEKHSSLFEATLDSRGLSRDVHAYWQYYLPSSISLVNYFHMVSRGHAHFFRYLGALLYTEATLAWANGLQSRTLRRLFPEAIDTRYFDEHVHIDVHHGRMALEKIILPVVRRCGEQIIPQIVRGFEEFALLQDLADADIIAQIEFSDRAEEHRARACALLADPDRAVDRALQRFDEPRGTLSVPHVHDEDELFFVDDGGLDFVTSPGQRLHLGAGQGILIPRGRLHGSLVTSERCRYSTLTLERGAPCAS
ncbi:iron-containing redox enzyme family protein [Sorangium sp. So ce117]|uniref:iron-containing redox enzyme family protein n=1 Tax=Sorangium sp. So ce117 TaxID=3133277 RepID=UPI003F5EC256